MVLLPKSIQIQTIDGCNRACPWCPNATIEKEKGWMVRRLFNKILDDLLQVDYRGAFHLYLMAEPLLDKRLPEWIAYTRKLFPTNIIFISTNGDLLKEENDLKVLFDAGLTWMGISHYDDSNKHLYELEGKYAIVNTPLNALRHTFYNRGGHVSITSVSSFSRCTWVYNKAYINWRGDMLLCCSDYLYETSFGNVAKENFCEIYNCEKYNTYRYAHQKNIGHMMPLCNRCDRISCQ